MTQTTAEFLAKGGKIQQVPEGERVMTESERYHQSRDVQFNPLRFCKCGCNGDATDHSMRQGENGNQEIRESMLDSWVRESGL